MNLNNLIQITNSEEFYQSSNFNCAGIEAENVLHRKVIFDFINEPEGIIKKSDIEKWRITAYKCEKFHDMYRKIFMPFIQLKLFDNHPLLWEYKSNMLICQLKKYPKNIDAFLGQIYQAHIKVSNNWMPATKNFYATEFAYKKSEKTSITIPENLKGPIQNICEIHNVDFEVKEIEQQDYKSKNVKVLVFGNDYISPDGFNIGQPYIIAENFTAEKIFG